jgi:hypothetical protein
MKTALIAVIVAIVAALVYADRKWRQWIAARRHEREDDAHRALNADR